MFSSPEWVNLYVLELITQLLVCFMFRLGCLTCILPEYAGRNRNVTVEVAGQLSAVAAEKVHYAPPEINSIEALTRNTNGQLKQLGRFWNTCLGFCCVLFTLIPRRVHLLEPVFGASLTAKPFLT